MHTTNDEMALGLLTISAMASILNVHQRTLRIYDKAGILCPKRTGKNRRSYSFDDIKRGKLIAFLTRNLGINIAGVKIILYLLKKDNIALEDSIKLLNETAKTLNINEDIQRENIEKSLKKGRKANKGKLNKSYTR